MPKSSLYCKSIEPFVDARFPKAINLYTVLVANVVILIQKAIENAWSVEDVKIFTDELVKYETLSVFG